MSVMATIAKPKDRPVVATILGEAGLGKTLLAASFPKPIFIRAEDGLASVDAKSKPDAFPLLASIDDLWDQLSALIKEEHQYRTLVIDSVTALERLFVTHIIESDPKKPQSINQALGGYGAGVAAVSALHQRVRKACGLLNERRGMHIVAIAHADTETVELPDSEPYTRYSLRLGKKSIAPWVDDADVVGFLKLETYYTGDGDRKKAVSTGQRVLVVGAAASNVSKNRFGITDELPVEKGTNPLAAHIPSLRNIKEAA